MGPYGWGEVKQQRARSWAGRELGQNATTHVAYLGAPGVLSTAPVCIFIIFDMVKLGFGFLLIMFAHI